jgi:hypothetical protein
MESAAGLIVSGAFMTSASWNEDLVFPEKYTNEENGYTSVSVQSIDSLESGVPARKSQGKNSTKHDSNSSANNNNNDTNAALGSTETKEKMWRGVRKFSGPAMYFIGWVLIIAGVSSSIHTYHSEAFVISLAFVPLIETAAGWCIKQYILTRTNPHFTTAGLSKVRKIIFHGGFSFFLMVCLFTSWAVVSAYGKADSADSQDGKFLAISAILIPFSELLLMFTRHREIDLTRVFPAYESAIEVLLAVMYYMRVLLPGSFIMFALATVKLSLVE